MESKKVWLWAKKAEK